MPYNGGVADDERRPGRPSPPLLRRVLATAGAVLLLAGFGWLWWQGVPALYRNVPDISPGERLKAVTDTRTALLAGLAALGALGTFWVNARAHDWQQNQQKRQLELMMSGQITDRFTRAIDQLGDYNVSVRIGGISALGRIARDSEVDRCNIATVLATFVRRSQPAQEAHHQKHVDELKIRAPDVQAALDLLCHAPLSDERESSSSTDQLDLSRTDLRRARLAGAHLERVNLWTSRLEGADLRGARLQGAVLSNANLGPFEPGNPRYRMGADLSKADLTGADFRGADLSRAILTEADLTGADLEGVNLTGALSLTQDQVDAAVGNELTRLPAGLRRPESWLAAGAPHSEHHPTPGPPSAP